MLQELLLALYGFPGAIFVESVEDQGSNLDSFLLPASEYPPSIARGELALCAELLKLGSSYNVVEKFIRRYAGPSNSLYMAAIGFGFDDALNPYRNALCALESEYLADPSLDVTHASYRLHRYKILLPILAELAKKIDEVYRDACLKSDVLGCRLLDVLLNWAPPGLPQPRFVVRKLLTRGLLVFHRQVSSWLLHGVLHDPHNEFFVRRDSPTDNTRDIGRLMSGDCSSHLDLFELVNNTDKDVSFSLAVNRIPSFLPTTFAQQVLFAGEAVNHAMRRSTSPYRDSTLFRELETAFSDGFKQLSDALYRSLTIDDSTSDTSAMANLINVTPLQIIVSEVRSFVSREVWHDLVEKNDLLAHLRLLKNIALLGRGELFLAFLDQLNAIPTSNYSSDPEDHWCAPVMSPIGGFLDRSAPSQAVEADEIRTLEYDVTCAFLAAVRAVGLDDDEMDARFRFYLSTKRDVTDSAECAVLEPVLWDCLHLELMVPPVFDLVFSKHVCRGYDRMFRYLAVIRRTQVALQQFWANQTALWRHTFAKRQFGRDFRNAIDPVRSRCTIDHRLLVRNHMAFIVENIQYYLQVDVIDSQFCHLLHRIQSDREADLVQVVHEAYLASLQAQSLLFHPTARPCIRRLLTVCQQYVHLASQSEYVSEAEQQLVCDFQQLSSNLFHCLSDSRQRGARPGVGLDSASLRRFDSFVLPAADLGQLLLRLDYNHYYSRANGTLGVAGSGLAVEEAERVGV